MKVTNEYIDNLPPGIFDKVPKAIWAAIAISYALNLRAVATENVAEEMLNEWELLYQNGIVPQKPPAARRVAAND